MIDINDPYIYTTIITILALVFAYRVKDRVIAFFAVAYPNARYSAMGNEFITRAGVGRVASGRTLQDAVSGASSRDFIFKETDMDSLDRELDNLLVSIIEMVKSDMPSPTSRIFDVFLLRSELRTLKRILRALHNGLEWQADPMGSLDHTTLQLLRESDDLLDLKYILRFTPYSEIMASEYKDSVPELEDVDKALDAFFFDQLRETIDDIRIWKRPYLEFLHLYSDIENIKLAFRIRETGGELEPEKLLSSGTSLGAWELQQMAMADTFEEAMRHLQGSGYDIVAEDIHVAERELDRKLLRLTSDLSRRYINTAGPSLHFVQSREYEIGNLRRIFRGIREGIPGRDIEKELVIID